MADAVRNYFDAKVPLVPSASTPLGPPAPDWRKSWTNLSKTAFLTLPQQLERCRVNRNKFLQAVK